MVRKDVPVQVRAGLPVYMKNKWKRSTNCYCCYDCYPDDGINLRVSKTNLGFEVRVFFEFGKTFKTFEEAKTAAEKVSVNMLVRK